MLTGRMPISRQLGCLRETLRSWARQSATGSAFGWSVEATSRYAEESGSRRYTPCEPRSARQLSGTAPEKPDRSEYRRIPAGTAPDPSAVVDLLGELLGER